MRQIGLACKQYAIDNSDSFPTNTSTAADAFSALTNGNYMAIGKIYNCPSDSTKNSGSSFGAGGQSNSYCYFAGITEANSSQQPLVLDKGLSGLGATPANWIFQTNTAANCAWSVSPHSRTDGGNVFFVGGHAKFVKNLTSEVDSTVTGTVLITQ